MSRWQPYALVRLAAMPNMKAIAVSKYGAIDNLIATEIPKPEKAEGYDLLVK